MMIGQLGWKKIDLNQSTQPFGGYAIITKVQDWFRKHFTKTPPTTPFQQNVQWQNLLIIDLFWGLLICKPAADPCQMPE